MKIAAIYARVSGLQQRESNTIASQTEALTEFARDRGYNVAGDRVFEDDGYSGAQLERPGLERVRDLAAEGRIEAVLVYEPDRLSRKYAYQVLLMEELARNGVETVFVKAPAMETPEERLLLQFQGMIAEYERAQILERSRRGKRHRARRGEVSVLSGAPYGYRYHKKTPDSEAWYEVTEPQAAVVRDVYRLYTVEHLSIGAITRKLNERGVPTRKGVGRWERSTVWAMLRNPAYKGTACYGKTTLAPRQRITRPVRLRGGFASRDSASHERPREEWIEIPVPAIVSEETFALAAERLHMNKVHAARRTRTPSLLQGLVCCRRCSYAMYRTSTRTSARKIYYYRCLGSDAWRRLNGPLCSNRPVRQDLLDGIVWKEIIRLLETPALVESEIDRRLQAARDTDPARRREQDLERHLARIRKRIGRLVNAYQEELITIEELRQRMPALRKQERALQAEWQSVANQAKEKETYLKLAETLNGFLSRLRSPAETLDVSQRQRIVRLLVKEVLVGEDTIVIRHSIPIPNTPQDDDQPDSESDRDHYATESYLLRSGSKGTVSVVYLQEDRPPTVIPSGLGAEAITVTPDGQAVWVINQDENTISIIDPETLAITEKFEAGTQPRRLANLPGGRMAVVYGNRDDEGIHIYDVRTREVLHQLAIPGEEPGAGGFGFLAVGDTGFLTTRLDGRILIYDFGDPESAPRVLARGHDTPDGMAWSPLRLDVFNQ